METFYSNPNGSALTPSVNTPAPSLLALQSYAKIAGVLIMGIGAAVLIAWIWDISILKSLLPELPTMKANTALCFLLGGWSLWHLTTQQQIALKKPTKQKHHQAGNITAKLANFTLIGISLLTLIQYALNADFGIDQLLFHDSTAPPNSPPGRMPIHAAFSFFLAGCALLLLKGKNYRLGQSLSLGALCLAFVGLLGYLYNNAHFYPIDSATFIAPHSAAALLIFNLGILFSRPDRGLMTPFADRGVGGAMARRLSPAAIIIPSLLGGLILLAYRTGIYSPEIGISLFSVSNTFIFLGLILWSSHSITIIDRAKNLAEQQLYRANEELETRVLERTAKLQKTNDKLQLQIAERTLAETELKKSLNLLQAVLEERYISERVETETTLRESLERFDLAVRSTLDGWWDTRIKADDNLNPQSEFYYSPRFKELLGYAENELKNILESWISRLHPDDYDRVLQALTNHLQHKIPYQNLEYRLQHKNGEYRWFSGSAQALWDNNGLPVRIAGSIRDITDRKKAENNLRLSEERYRSLVMATSQMVWITDGQGVVINDMPSWRAYTGQTLEQCLGWGWIDAIHPEDRPYTAEKWNQALESKSIYEVEHRVRGGDGEYRYFWVRGVPVMAEDGSIREWVGIDTDITERKLAEDALRQSEARYRQQATQLRQTLQQLQKTQAQLVQSEKISSLGQLVAGVAHEINNPINFIYGNILYTSEYAQDLLKMLNLYQTYYPQPAPEISEEAENIDLDFISQDLPRLLSSMRLGAERIRDLVVSLRNFSRLDEAQMKAVDIHQGIESTLLILQHRLKSKGEGTGIEIIKEYGDIPLIECHAGQLNQVFMNILANAIDAIEDYSRLRLVSERKSHAGQIRIRTQMTENGWIAIRISDNGPGIPHSVMSRLFDPFFTTKPVGKGTGLGLSISYQIVEKHGGHLKCHSSPGEGAEFSIEIPICQSSPQIRLQPA